MGLQDQNVTPEGIGKLLSTICSKKLYAKIMMRHSCSLMKGFFQNHNDNGSIPLFELYQMDVGAISPNGDLYMKVYS